MPTKLILITCQSYLACICYNCATNFYRIALELGSVYEKLGRHGEALITYNLAIEKAPAGGYAREFQRRIDKLTEAGHIEGDQI